MKKTTSLLAIPALTLMLTGCGGPEDFTPASGMSAEEIFASACSGCHGDKGSGKFGFLLKIAGDADAAAEVDEKLKYGGKIMPSFPNIGEADRAALAEYIKSL